MSSLVDRLFDDALDLPLAEREAFLNRVPADAQPALRRLLRAADAPSFLDTPAPVLAASLLPADLADGTDDDADDLLAPGTRVGAWRIEERAGEGGMGVVYRAVRADGAFERTVAIKVVKRGMDTDAVVRRFRRERTLLARLDHPSIARLIDGGTTPDGRPFFAMEFVDGTPLTAYATDRGLSVEGRLRLMIAVCDAVAFAHRGLVVHQDLKPSNVLVTSDGQPRLLDFGIARLLDGGDEDGIGEATHTGLRRLTPSYAAPEQFTGDPATTATDVFALGVLLYELLTGVRPFARTDARDRLPPPPSARVQAGGDAAAPRLARRVARDLDAVVLRALDPDPRRRYASADALANDLRRGLAHQPVAARPAAWSYRARLFVRRHRVGVAAGTLAVLALAAGSGAVAWQARAAAAARDRALAEAARADAVRDMLVRTFQAANIHTGGDTLTARDLLDRGAAELAAARDLRPALRAEMQQTFGELYTTVGVYPAARRHFEQALAFRTPAADAERGWTLASMGHLEAQIGAYERADSFFRAAHLAAPADPRVSSLALQGLGRAALNRRDLRGADTLLAAAADAERHVAGFDVRQSARSQHALALLLAGRDADAERAMHAYAADVRRAFGPDDLAVVDAREVQASYLLAEGRFREALPAVRQIADARRRQQGPRHPALAETHVRLGGALVEVGEAPAAVPILRDALRVMEARFGPQHLAAADARRKLGAALVAVGRTDEGLTALRQGLATFEREVPSGNWVIAWERAQIARVEAGQNGRWAAAEAALRASLPVVERERGPQSWHARTLRAALAEARARVR